MSEEKTPQPRRGRLRFILAVGLVFIVANLAFAGWWGGYFRQREKIAIVTWNQDPYWDLVIQGAQDDAREKNVDLTVVRSAPDEKSQSQIIRNLLDSGIQGIAISPNNPAAQETLLNEVAEKAVLVTFDSDAPVAKRKAFVGTDNYGAGQASGDEIRSAIPDGGEVIISVGSTDMINGRERRQGIIDNLMDRHGKPSATTDPVNAELKGSKYSIVATILDHGDAALATSMLTDSIKAHPDVKCIAGLFSYSAPAIVKAIDASGKKGQIKVIGFDELDATQAGVEDGTIYSSILQDQYRCGRETVVSLVDALRGTDRYGPASPWMIPTRIWVMNKSNLTDLRADKMIHQPAASAPH